MAKKNSAITAAAKPRPKRSRTCGGSMRSVPKLRRAPLALTVRRGKMTFEQFQASKDYCTNLGEFLSDASLMGIGGFIYEGDLHIEDASGGDFSLMLDRDQWGSSDLTELERKLYDFAISEQILTSA